MLNFISINQTPKIIKKYLVEFIGTFFLVLAALLGGGPAAAATLMVMVYAGAHISGANYNPAVSLGLFVRGKLSVTEMAVYWVCQIVAGIAAALVVTYLLHNGVAGNAVNFDSRKAALVAEALGTFALVFVVLNVATVKANNGNSFYGIAIGGTVLGMALAVGGFSGGAFNPAVAIGALVNGAGNWANLWVFIVAEVLGAIAAAMVFKFVKAEED